MAPPAQPYYKERTMNPSAVLPMEGKGCWSILLMLTAAIAGLASFVSFLAGLGALSFMTKPFDFGMQLAFVLLAMCMAALDVPQLQQKGWATAMRDFCWRHVFFLTTFTGRGLAYMVCGTWSWLALWDEGTNIIMMAIAAGTTSWLLVFGWSAYRKGQILTRRLAKIRDSMNRRGDTSDNYFRIGADGEERLPLTREQWRAVFEQHDGRPHYDIEIDYMVAALSMKPFSTTEIEKVEFDEWLGASSLVPFWV